MNSNIFFTNDDAEFEKYIEQAPKDSRDIKKALKIEQGHLGVYVCALATNENYELNKRIEVPTTFGTPLTAEVHDTVRDVYYLEGVDIHEVGLIPVNYRIFIEDSDWESYVPLPFSVIKRYLSDEQKFSYYKWSSAYKGRGFHIRLVQILGLI
jgi:hypothetical protein